MRLLLWIILAWVGYQLWRKWQLYSRATPHNTQDTLTPEPMVQCAYCSVHLPQHMAVSSDQKWFCNAEHQKAFNAPC